MAFTSNAIGRVRISGNDANGAFFDPSLCTLTDLAATSGTGTAPVVTSASYNFVTGDVGAYVFIKSGTNWIPGWYLIFSVSGGAATLTATIGSVRLFSSTTPSQNGDLKSFNTSAGCASTGSPTSGTWSIDYSQQDAPVASASAGTSNASTTFTDAGSLFTVAMIGNALRLASGTNGTVGYYFITAVASGTSLTTDRNSSTGAMTDGVWRIGGGALTVKRITNSANATGDEPVAGNCIFIQGAGTDTPGSNDYTMTGFYTPVSGTGDTNWVRYIGENGRPRISSDGYMLSTVNRQQWENMYLTASSNSNGSFGIVEMTGASLLRNMVIDTNNQATLIGVNMAGNSTILIDSEVKSGTTTPTASAGADLVKGGSNNSRITRCRIHHGRDHGVNTATGGGPSVRECLIYENVGNGINIATTTNTCGDITGNTINDNEGHGVSFASAIGLMGTTIERNLITNHTGGSKYAINVATGIAADNDRLKRYIEYNWLYNNTGNYNGITPPGTDSPGLVGGTGTDPGYTDAANGDFTIGTASTKTFIQETWRGQSTPIGYRAPGAVQPQGASSGGTKGFAFS